MVKRLLVSITLTLLATCWIPAHAAKTFNLAQTSPAPTPQFDMGTTQTVTFTVTNTSTGGDTSQRIFKTQFTLPTTCPATPCTLTTFSSATTAPAGWTRTAISASSVTFQASAWDNAIAVPGNGPVTSVAFPLTMVVGSFTADYNPTQTISKVAASFSNRTNFGGAKLVNCNKLSGKNSCGGSLGLWKTMSLQITNFQTTSDAAGTIPVTTVSSGNSFYLAVTVRNLSSVTQSSVNITNLTAFKTGSWQGSSPSCGSPTPASLSLNAGASGKIVFTCTTNANDSGTVYFTANARNGTGSTVTSRTAQSNSLAVGKFTATLKINTSPNTQCAYLNGTMTVTMDLTNGFTYSITGITPSALTVRDSLGNVVTGVLTLVSGPTPASVASIAAANPPGTPTVTITNAFTWTYRFDGGNAGETYSLSGTASGTASGCASNCGRVTPISTSTVKRGGYSPVVSPSLVNASSINVQLQWSLTNNGCTHVKKVAIAAPSGWTLGNDPYSLIEQSNPPNAGNTPIENAWLVTTSGNTTDFTAQSPPSDSFPLIPASPKSADIALVVNTPVTGGTCPATPAMNNFTVTITDLNNVPVALTTGIGVCQFGYGVGNKVDPSVWREIFH